MGQADGSVGEVAQSGEAVKWGKNSLFRVWSGRLKIIQLWGYDGDVCKHSLGQGNPF